MCLVCSAFVLFNRVYLVSINYCMLFVLSRLGTRNQAFLIIESCREPTKETDRRVNWTLYLSKSFLAVICFCTSYISMSSFVCLHAGFEFLTPPLISVIYDFVYKAFVCIHTYIYIYVYILCILYICIGTYIYILIYNQYPK